MKYKHLFFDLDHTLWDFERSCGECLTDLYQRYQLEQAGIGPLDAFIATYLRINYELWRALELGTIPHSQLREERFRRVLDELGGGSGIDCACLEEEYLLMLPTKPYLIDGTFEVLDHARARGYSLHILTNGFDLIQRQKMHSAGIPAYFTHLVTHEKANARKPDRRIFDYALECVGAQGTECLMIGDNWEADILGASRAGLDTAYYNPGDAARKQGATYELLHLSELLHIL